MLFPQSILVATDFGALGQHAVDKALALAQRCASRIHLVHVRSDEVTAQVLQRLRTDPYESACAAEGRLALLAQRVRVAGLLGETRTMTGDPSVAILALADELDVDLIVMGTHGRTGLARAIIGSTAESVLRGASCPVLVVKQTQARAVMQNHDVASTGRGART